MSELKIPAKPVVAVRLPVEMLAEIRRQSPSVTRAVEEGLMLWLARQKRRQARAPSPARLQPQPSPPGGAA